MESLPGLDLGQPPFDLLDEAGRKRLAACVDMGFHPRGETIIAAGAPSERVVVILKGRVQAFDVDAAGHEQRFAGYGSGDLFGAWAVMAGRARHGYRADTDVVSYLIPAPVFRQLLGDYPPFAAWFQEGLAVKGQLARRGRDSELAELMVTPVGAAELAPAVRVPATTTIAEVSALNSRIMARLYELLLPPELQGQACLLVLGSEGRREQLLRTDQDNALVVADGCDAAALEEPMAAFSRALGEIGYPPCPGGVMVSNPHWRMRAAQWRARLQGWRSHYDAQAAMALSITLDARPVAGDAALFAPLDAQLQALGGDERLLHAMARAALQFDNPLSFFGQLRQDERGLDIKRGGIFPIVHGLRCLALRQGIGQRNSFARCEALVQAGALDAALGRDLAQTLSVLQRMRLDAQLAALDAGETPGNHLHPEALRRLDRDLLRDALRVVKAFQQHLRLAFHLGD